MPGDRKADSRFPGSSKAETRTTGSSKADSRTPESSNAESRTPGSSKAKSRTPGSSKAESRTPGSSKAYSKKTGSPCSLLESNDLGCGKTGNDHLESSKPDYKMSGSWSSESSTCDSSISLDVIQEQHIAQNDFKVFFSSIKIEIQFSFEKQMGKPNCSDVNTLKYRCKISKYIFKLVRFWRY